MVWQVMIDAVVGFIVRSWVLIIKTERKRHYTIYIFFLSTKKKDLMYNVHC